MAMRHAEKPVFGLQFHPESVLTPEGTKILANFLDIAGEVLRNDRASGTSQVVAAAGGAERLSEEATTVTDIAGALARVTDGLSLSEDEAHAVMGQIMDGEATPAQISGACRGPAHEGRDGR